MLSNVGFRDNYAGQFSNSTLDSETIGLVRERGKPYSTSHFPGSRGF